MDSLKHVKAWQWAVVAVAAWYFLRPSSAAPGPAAAPAPFVSLGGDMPPAAWTGAGTQDTSGSQFSTPGDFRGHAVVISNSYGAVGGITNSSHTIPPALTGTGAAVNPSMSTPAPAYVVPAGSMSNYAAAPPAVLNAAGIKGDL
jgi:hypothetical protein